MQRKTYYRTLGVSHTESPSGNRAAYRGLVKRAYPDLAGEQSTRAFPLQGLGVYNFSLRVHVFCTSAAH